MNNEVIRRRVQTPHERQSHVEAMNKKKPRGGGLIGAQVWGVIKRKPRLGARGFQLDASWGWTWRGLTRWANRAREQTFRKTIRSFGGEFRERKGPAKSQPFPEKSMRR